MKTMILLSLSVVFLYFGCQTEIKELSEPEVREIQRTEQDFVQAELEGELDGSLALLTENVVWMPPGSPVMEGKEMMEEYFEDYPGHTFDYTFTPLVTYGQGGMAYNRGRYTRTFLFEGDTLRENGKYLQIWEKQPDATWLMSLQIWNTDALAEPQE